MDVLVAPLFVHLPLPNAGDVTYTCPMAQGAPDMVARALAAEGSPTRVLRPVLFEKEGEGFDAPRRPPRRCVARPSALWPRRPGARRPAARRRVRARLRRRAATPSAASRRGLRAIGARALAWAREHGYPVVLIAGETHVIHDAVLDAGIHELVAANGALPLPVDCYPVPADVPGLRRVHWASAGQTLRAAAAGAMAGDVFPLLLGAYGCGPNSMIEHLFADLVEDWPHAVLESDGHGGKAGYVTRVQAFLHSVRAWRGAARPRRRRRARAARPRGAPARASTGRLPHSLDAGYDRFFFGHVGGGLGRHLAAAMRGAGFDAALVGEPDAAALRAAGAACSGKECLPYQLIWGSFARFLEEEAAAARRPAGPVPQRRQRLPGLPRQPLPAHRADLARAARPRRPRRGRRLQPRHRQRAHDARRLDRAGRRRPAQHAALLPPRRRSASRGDADALFAEYSARLEAMLEQPRPDAGAGRQRGRGLRASAREVEELLARGGAAPSATLPARPRPRPRDLRDVYLCGDLYLRVDEWGNDDLQRKLADHGLRVHLRALRRVLRAAAAAPDPGRRARSRKLPEKERHAARRCATSSAGCVKAVRADHPWVFWNDVRDVDRESRRLVAPYPFGETIPDGRRRAAHLAHAARRRRGRRWRRAAAGRP